MTDKLRQEAREAAEKLLPNHFNLDEDCWYSCPMHPDSCNDGDQCNCNLEARRADVEAVYIRAATAREKELEELSVRNKDLAAAIGAWQSARESDQREIEELKAERSTLIDTWAKYKAIKDAESASLWAKLEAVPVEAIVRVFQYVRMDCPREPEIERWLATVGK